jgi:membrane protein required for colicin V production
VALVMTVLKIILHKFVKSIGLSGLNYAIGGLFGIVRGIIVCALVIILIEMFNTDEQHSWQKSWLSPILTPCVGFIVDAVPERIKNINHEAGKIVQGYQGKESELESALIGK